MLLLILPRYDDLESIELKFEHSLVSLSKWEAFYEKPFFSKEAKTEDETLTYITHMLVSDYNLQDLKGRLNDTHVLEIQKYLNSKQTATTFREEPNAQQSREIITAELVYYWMVAFKIPFTPCEDWNFSKLMTLIRICGVKQAKPKKMTRQQQHEEYKRLNAQRRQELGTTG